MRLYDQYPTVMLAVFGENLMSKPSRISRRAILAGGSSALMALAISDSPLFNSAQERERTIPWLDQFPPPPKEIAEEMGTDMNLLDRQSLDTWITPIRKFFRANHYKTPVIDAKRWRLEIAGLVDKTSSYSLDEIKALPKKDVVFVMECSGNSGFPWFEGGVGNARWRGTPLAPVLEKAGLKKGVIEVVFFGTDGGEETVPYIGGGGEKFDDIKMKLEFARSMSVIDALDPANVDCDLEIGLVSASK